MPAIIRLADENDIAAVSAIYDDIHSAEEHGRLTVGWKRGVYPTSQTARPAVLKHQLYVIDNDGVIVSSAVINHEQPPAYSQAKWSHPCDESEVLVLHTLTVPPRYSRRGFGRMMVEYYEAMAKKLNIHCLRLDTNAKNTVARKMYQSLGYAEKGIVPCEFNGIDGVFLVCLEKILKK